MPFLGIRRKLSTVFHPQIDGQTKRQNSTIKAYLQFFVKFEQNDRARLLPMAEFAYNNIKNASIGCIFFELNCRYHLRIFYEKDLDPHLKSRTTKKLSSELRKLMIVCQQNLNHAQELQKRGHNNEVRP